MDKFERYKEEKQVGDAEALRRLVRQSLEPTKNNSLFAVALISAVLYAVAMSPPIESTQWGAIIGGTMIGYTLVWSKLDDLYELVKR